MQSILIFSSLVAAVLARPGTLPEGIDGHVAVTQSSLGSYKYSVQLRDSSRHEERLDDGTVIGEYTVPVLGHPQTFKYIADLNGFRILEGPVPVAPVIPVLPASPEVVHNLNLVVPGVQNGIPFVAIPDYLPLVPIEDTPEVKAAREAHLALHRAASHS